MDIASLGVDAGVIIAIGAISEAIKKADPENKFKRFYLLIPVALSAICAVGVALSTQEWSSLVINIVKYFGVSNLGYGVIKKTILKK